MIARTVTACLLCCLLGGARVYLAMRETRDGWHRQADECGAVLDLTGLELHRLAEDAEAALGPCWQTAGYYQHAWLRCAFGGGKTEARR